MVDCVVAGTICGAFAPSALHNHGDGSVQLRQCLVPPVPSGGQAPSNKLLTSQCKPCPPFSEGVKGLLCSKWHDVCPPHCHCLV